MDAYRLSPSDERLTELVDRVEAGENIEIERGGRIVARIVSTGTTSVATAPFDWPAYWQSIKNMPVYPGNSVVDMREEARY